MFKDNAIWMGVGAEPDNKPVSLLLDQANRHGLIAGASGTGKTVTLKVMAEGFSKAGVPVFMADVKGDITGMCSRITVSDMGPTLLSRLLELSEVQEGVLDIVFRIADDKNLLLIDLKDLRSMLNYVTENAKEYETTYGKVSSQSVGAILRQLISVEDQGGDVFFGEPDLDLSEWFACDSNGHGYVNVLNAAKLIQNPQIYAMFLLWMLSELFDTLPEEGDLEKPKFVFFFDEAHLLFNDMPSELLDKIVQVVKLIRSKGVGVYFITQSPSDIPDEVLSPSSPTACSTACAPTRRPSRRSCAPPRSRSARTRPSRARTRSWSSAPARRSSRSSTTTVSPRSWSAPRSCRRSASWPRRPSPTSRRRSTRRATS